MPSILTLTMNPALDVFFKTPHLKPNGKLRCTQPLRMPGGGGINVSRAIRRLGGNSTALFPAGGLVGNRLIELLAFESIAPNALRIEEETRENVNVVESETRLEYRFIPPGPTLRVDEWERVLQTIRTHAHRSDYLVASGSLPPGVPVDFYGRLDALSFELGLRLIVDTSDEPLRHAGGKGTFLIKPNVGELMRATTGEPVSEAAVMRVARSLVDAGRCKIAVVSAGAGGALLADRRGTKRIAAPVVPIGSRVGAGDSMVAGITLALANGSGIDDAVIFGVAAGTAAVMTRHHELCSLEETQRLFDEIRQSCAPLPDATMVA